MSTATLCQPRTFLWRSRNWISFLVLSPALLAVACSTPSWTLDFWGRCLCQVLGWLLFLAGACFRWWGMLYISGHKDMQLVQQGPYSVCRHPLYLGTFLLGMSFGVLLHSVILLAGLLIASVVYLGITLPREERRLMELYGDAYRQYLRSVPRLLPNFARLSTPESITVNLSGVRAELLRTVRWALLPLAAHLVAEARLEAWWPHWLTLP